MKEMKESGPSTSGTETPTDSAGEVQKWVTNALREKAARAHKDYRARCGQHKSFTLRSNEERAAVVESLKSGAWKPAEAKGSAFVGCIETDSLGGLLIFVATKGDMVSATEMRALLERTSSMPKDPLPRRNDGETSVIDLYRTPRPIGHIVLPDGTLADAATSTADAIDMSREFARIID